jgi:hypothetical protein
LRGVRPALLKARPEGEPRPTVLRADCRAATATPGQASDLQLNEVSCLHERIFSLWPQIATLAGTGFQWLALNLRGAMPT